MFKSIRWKFIIIYFLLVFMAMIIIGVFLTNQFEEYHLQEVRTNLNRIANAIESVLNYTDWQQNQEDVQKDISDYGKIGMEIYIIKNDENITTVASTNLSYLELGRNAADKLEIDLILAAFNGERREKDIIAKEAGMRSSKDYAVPLFDEHSRITGAIYLSKNLGDIYKTLEQSRAILIRATLLALFITIFVGYFIAKSITGPINDVTIKAAKMAKGDFDQVVEVKSDDEIGQLAGMFNYLTARLKSVLSEMSNEKQKMDTIITYMADGLIAVNTGGKIIHANPRAYEMLHIDETTIKEKSFDEVMGVLNERLRIEYLKDSENQWSGSQIIDMEEGIKLRANYAPYRNEKGELDGIIVLLQDVTQHEKLENMRKEFVANVSHELKTPLTTIKSYTETLLDGAIENRELTTHFLTVIDSEADRMARLVRDLLQLSNIDFHQTKWNKRETNIANIIEKVVVKLEVSAKNKQQQLSLGSSERDLIVLADEDRIEQVLLNIISNSIKYTPSQGHIHIATKQEEEIAVIIIEDNGIGIPASDLPRIFERFYRVDKARSREMGGTGLGLSIARQIIDAHEGTIEIASKEEQGTKVTIRLPLVRAKDNQQENYV